MGFFNFIPFIRNIVVHQQEEMMLDSFISIENNFPFSFTSIDMCLRAISLDELVDLCFGC